MVKIEHEGVGRPKYGVSEGLENIAGRESAKYRPTTATYDQSVIDYKYSNAAFKEFEKKYAPDKQMNIEFRLLADILEGKTHNHNSGYKESWNARLKKFNQVMRDLQDTGYVLNDVEKSDLSGLLQNRYLKNKISKKQTGAKERNRLSAQFLRAHALNYVNNYEQGESVDYLLNVDADEPAEAPVAEKKARKEKKQAAKKEKKQEVEKPAYEKKKSETAAKTAAPEILLDELDQLCLLLEEYGANEYVKTETYAEAKSSELSTMYVEPVIEYDELSTQSRSINPKPKNPKPTNSQSKQLRDYQSRKKPLEDIVDFEADEECEADDNSTPLLFSKIMKHGKLVKVAASILLGIAAVAGVGGAGAAVDDYHSPYGAASGTWVDIQPVSNIQITSVLPDTDSYKADKVSDEELEMGDNNVKALDKDIESRAAPSYTSEKKPGFAKALLGKVSDKYAAKKEAKKAAKMAKANQAADEDMSPVQAYEPGQNASDTAYITNNDFAGKAVYVRRQSKKGFFKRLADKTDDYDFKLGADINPTTGNFAMSAVVEKGDYMLQTTAGKDGYRLGKLSKKCFGDKYCGIGTNTLDDIFLTFDEHGQSITLVKHANKDKDLTLRLYRSKVGSIAVKTNGAWTFKDTSGALKITPSDGNIDLSISETQILLSALGFDPGALLTGIINGDMPGLGDLFALPSLEKKNDRLNGLIAERENEGKPAAQVRYEIDKMRLNIVTRGDLLNPVENLPGVGKIVKNVLGSKNKRINEAAKNYLDPVLERLQNGTATLTDLTRALWVNEDTDPLVQDVKKKRAKELKNTLDALLGSDACRANYETNEIVLPDKYDENLHGDWTTCQETKEIVKNSMMSVRAKE